jgi:hypothetical protein
MVARVYAGKQRELRSTRIKQVEPLRSREHVCTRSRARPAKIMLLFVTLAVGCSQILGFKDPRLLSGDDGGGSDGGTTDGSAGSAGSDGSVDAPADSGAAALWVFTTTGAFQGDFGTTNGGRVGADSKCDAAYKVAFMARQCTNVHAVIQVDNVDDTLDRMSGKFQIPGGVPVFRATDATKVANEWNDVVNRTVQLLAPVSTSGTSLLVWSGRGTSANRHCNSWQSKDPALLGDAGDATKVSSWLSQMTFTCDSITPHLLCVCW